jgi:hypothetical protein
MARKQKPGTFPAPTHFGSGEGAFLSSLCHKVAWLFALFLMGVFPGVASGFDEGAFVRDVFQDHRFYITTTPAEFDNWGPGGHGTRSYEDIDPITDICPTYTGTTPFVSVDDLAPYADSENSQADYDHLKNDLVGPGGKFLVPGGWTTRQFFNQYMSLWKGYCTWCDSLRDDGTPVHPVHPVEGTRVNFLPYDLVNSAQPFYTVFSAEFLPGWSYIPPLDFPPPAPGWEMVDGVWNFPNLKGEVLSTKVRVSSFHLKSFDSTVFFRVHLRDRTPPRLVTTLPNRPDALPDLAMPGGGDRKSTTGDFYSPDGFTFVDNSGGRIWSCFGIGQILTPPADPVNWTAGEVWKWVGVPKRFESGSTPGHAFMPNDCHGFMRYTAFAWDGAKNMNPGEVNILENEPMTCYGLRATHPLFAQLLKVPHLALDFPVKATEPYEDIDIEQRVPNGEGYIWVEDNDAPNLAIKIENVRDRMSPTARNLFFPPPPGLPFQSIDSVVTNGFFTNPLLTANDLMTSTNPGDSYVKILHVDLDGPRSQVLGPERLWGSKFLGSGDPLFPQKHFRLENYGFSDTDVDGNPLIDANSFGERNGFGPEAVVFCSVPLIEDVEYEISLWAEDNVKWVNTDAEKLVLRTGIPQGSLTVRVRNQFPEVVRTVSAQTNALCTPPLSVVFREPIKEPETLSIPFLEANGYPFVEAEVTDWKGNTRRLKVFFWVKDEKTRVRVIERKYHRDN